METGRQRWQEAALRAPLWEGERAAYAASITTRMTGPYAGEIVSDYKYVEDIETGRPAYDMKRMLNTSMKVRVSKKGKRYLIIPIRHNTPGSTAHAPAMPKNVYAAARQLAPSRITGHGRRLSGTGAYHIPSRSPYTVRSRQYAWGGRLEAGHDRKLLPGKKDRYAGMVRFAAGKGSTYLTFRVMVEGSSGWVKRPKPGLHIAKAVAQSLERDAASLFPQALATDLAAA
jgi:hypothetical protein